MVMHGYQDRMHDAWEPHRFAAYVTYCSVTEMKDRVSVYDFYPLPNDPSKEELAKMERSGKDAMIERFIKKGWLKGPNPQTP